MDQGNSSEEYYARENAAKPKKKSPISGLIPTQGYFITPILININLLVFVVMVASGVSATFPDAAALLKWGALDRYDVMHGEPWRMLTSMFLHCGIIHIAFNMYALFQIGSILEPFIGRWRFLILYLLAGLGGSAVSLWWHADSVGAGASGAIFGTFGILAALLTTDLIDQSIRKQMLRSISIAIGLNLLIGLNGLIDNSAHIGGLLTGAMGGYLSYFDLKSWYIRRIKKHTGLILATIFSAGIIVTLWVITPVPDAAPLVASSAFSDLYKEFADSEKKASDFSKTLNSGTDAASIQKNYVAPYKNCLKVATSMAKLDEPEGSHALAENLQLYAEIRLEAAQYIYRERAENRIDFTDSAIDLNHQADSIVSALNAEEEKQHK